LQYDKVWGQDRNNVIGSSLRIVTPVRAKNRNSDDEDVNQQSSQIYHRTRRNLRTITFNHKATIGGYYRRSRVDFAPIRLQENIAFECIDRSSRDRILLGRTDFHILRTAFVQKPWSNRKDW